MRRAERLGLAALVTLVIAAGPAPNGKAPSTSPATPLATPPAAASAPVGALPQQTTATFGDWTLRCSQPSGGAKYCELAQGVQRDGKAVAEMAIGSAGPGRRLQFTLLVPTSVSFAAPPILAPSSGDGAGLTLAWRRCLPIGCFADVEFADDVLLRLRGWTQPGRVSFSDGAGRPATVPVSPLGLSQALDALAKEDAG